MKKTVLLLIIGMCIFFSCKKENEKTEQNSETSSTTKDEIYSTADTKGYLNFDKELNEYTIVGLKDPQKFSTDEISFAIKENDFEYNKSDDFDFYTIKSFDLGDINYKIIAYNSYGENDAKVLNIQLNSYQSGVPVDGLLLDCRFEFETEYYRNFVINKDKTIVIKKIKVEKLLYNENSDIIGKKEINDTLIDVVRYIVNPLGNFSKL